MVIFPDVRSDRVRRWPIPMVGAPPESRYSWVTRPSHSLNRSLPRWPTYIATCHLLGRAGSGPRTPTMAYVRGASVLMVMTLITLSAHGWSRFLPAQTPENQTWPLPSITPRQFANNA